MVLKLHGSSQSTCTRRVATVLHEKKIPFELITVDVINNEHKTSGYREKQPFGQIPYIDDDGFILYESRAICRYLANKYKDQGLQLIPQDPKGNALFEQAASVELSNFDPYASQAVAEVVFKPYRGQTPDPEVFKRLIAQLSDKLDAYEAILGKQRYLGGNTITLADLFHLPYGAMLAVAGSDILNEKPNVKRWFSELSNRPAWQAVKDGNFTSNNFNA